MRRRAFMLLEVVLYAAVLMSCVPLLIASVRLVGRVHQLVHELTVTLPAHRRALYAIVRDISACDHFEQRGNALICDKYNEWIRTYQWRTTGLWRVQRRYDKGRWVRSGLYLAPSKQPIEITPVDDWVWVKYQVSDKTTWQQPVYRGAQ